MRTTLKFLMENFLLIEKDKFPRLSKRASVFLESAIEDSFADEIIAKNYFDLKANDSFAFKIEDYPPEEVKDAEMAEPESQNEQPTSQQATFSMSQMYKQMFF
jgi:hypothetical protein